MAKVLSLIPESLHQDLFSEVLDQLATDNTAAKVHAEKIKTLVEKHSKADATIKKVVDELTQFM